MVVEISNGYWDYPLKSVAGITNYSQAVNYNETHMKAATEPCGHLKKIYTLWPIKNWIFSMDME